MTYLTQAKSKSSFIFILASIYLLAVYMRQQFFLNWDVSTLLLASERLLQGGDYLNDFFTPNPPMIMFLYALPVLISKLTHLNIIMVFYAYIFLLASLSLFMSYRLIIQIFKPEDRFQAYLFITVLAVIFLIAPLFEFGQRDHLLVMMTMPYILVSAYRLNQNVVSTRFALGIGLFAGFVIALKPQFLMLPLLIESYFLFKKRDWPAWRKPEIMAMATVLTAYLIILIVTRQDYLTVMIPYLVNNYYSNPALSLHKFLLAGPITYCYMAVPSYVLLNKLNKYPHLGTILCLSLIAFITSYMSQRYALYYHMMPALALAVLMLLQIYTNIVSQKDLSTWQYSLLFITLMMWLVFTYERWSGITTILYIYPYRFFYFFAVFIFALLFILKPSRSISFKLATVTYIIAMGYLISLIGINITWMQIQFFATVFVMLLLFAFMSENSFKKRAAYFLIGWLGLVMFAIPISIANNLSIFGYAYKKNILDKLIAFIKTQPAHTSIYTLSDRPYYSFPLNYYTDIVIGQRFDSLWMISAIVTEVLAGGDEKLLDDIKNNNSKTYFLNMITDDFKKHMPDIIFVERKTAARDKFDYLHYFLQNAKFSQIFEKYQYLTTIQIISTVSLDVYKLKQTIS